MNKKNVTSFDQLSLQLQDFLLEYINNIQIISLLEEIMLLNPSLTNIDSIEKIKDNEKIIFKLGADLQRMFRWLIYNKDDNSYNTIKNMFTSIIETSLKSILGKVITIAIREDGSVVEVDNDYQKL